jgi:hypothetical protein
MILLFLDFSKMFFIEKKSWIRPMDHGTMINSRSMVDL